MFNARTATEGARGNGQDVGMTQRSPASAFMCVDSFDRHQPGVPTGFIQQPINNFVVQKRQTFISGFFHRLGLTEVRFPYAGPNINPRNNVIDVSNNGTTVSVTIPEGYYTPVELAAELQAQLTAQVGAVTWGCAYLEEQGKFDLSGNSNFTLSPYDFGNDLQTRKGLYYMMNWANTSTPAQNFKSLAMPNLQYTSYIDICSRALTQFQQVKDNSTRENQAPGLLCRLYLNNTTNENLGDGNTSAKLTWPGCRPQMIHRLFPAPKLSAWQPGQFVDAVDITLYDDAGNLLYYSDATNTTNDFQLSFTISEN